MRMPVAATAGEMFFPARAAARSPSPPLRPTKASNSTSVGSASAAAASSETAAGAAHFGSRDAQAAVAMTLVHRRALATLDDQFRVDEEPVVDFDGEDFPRQMGEEYRLISRAGTDVQHLLRTCQFQRLNG